MKRIIIFLGAPGSGKGTQAQTIVKKYNYLHISTGDILRRFAKNSFLHEDELKALEAMKEGHLVPDWLIFRLAFKEIETAFKDNVGVVLDGAIRTIAQAEGYQEFFKKNGVEDEIIVIEIKIDDTEAFKRLVHRKICKNCQQVYPNLEVRKIPSECAVCGGELIMRADDDERIAHNRIAEQGSALINPLHKFYKEQETLYLVDGKKSMEDVEKEIDHILLHT
jgi:adenylate kinase